MARHAAAIAERAGNQLGLIRSADLAELGVSRQQQRTLRQHGVLIRVGPGLDRHAGFATNHDQRLLAAAWIGGPQAVISHMAAAGVWRFDGVQLTAVEVSVPTNRMPRSVVGRLHRVRDLRGVDVAMVGLLPLTTPSRTLIDVAPRMRRRELEAALDGACRRQQIYLPYLEWRLDELRKRGRPGVGAIDALLRHHRRQQNDESWLESAFLRLVRDSGLPPPRTQVCWTDTSDGRRMRVDGAYDEQRLVVEIDGHATHATRRQRQADAERDARLLAAGIRVIRFTYEDIVERPGYVCATLAAFLGLEVAA